jgi:hypothetical protein
MPDHCMNYLETDVPAGLTLVDWRRARREQRTSGRVRPARFQRLRLRRPGA